MYSLSMELQLAMFILGLQLFIVHISPFVAGTYASEIHREDPAIIPDNVFEPDGDGRSSTPPSFRQLLIDPKSASIYVGGRGFLYRLWLYNINDTGSVNLFTKKALPISSEERDECLRGGNTALECDAWVRLIFIKSNGQLLVCSSRAMKPELQTLGGLTLEAIDQPRTVIGICSPHGDINTTAVFTETGNPDDLPAIYSGIRTGSSLENHLLYRPPLEFNHKEVHPALRTVFTDSRWLNDPQFVASFAINQYVYFFFREMAAESEVAGGLKSVYSRVARVCKKDMGGKNVLRHVWSTFVKLRLNCSMPSSAPSQPPFYFDYIQSVVKVELEQDTYFYATLTTRESTFLQATALCVFRLSAINKEFDTGLFLEQQSSLSLWGITSPERVPFSRPGTCLRDSRVDISDEDLHFAKSHLLMAHSVEGEVLSAERGAVWTKLVADNPQKGASRIVLLILEPFTRSLLKILHDASSNAAGQTIRVARDAGGSAASLLARYRLPGSEKINEIAVLPGEHLLTAGEQRLSQYGIGQCPLYRRCDLCSLDPYCSWNIAREMCFRREHTHSGSVGWVIASSGADRCGKYTRSRSRTIYPGDAAHLECEGLTRYELEHFQLEWLVDRKPIGEHSGGQFLRSFNGGLVLLNASKPHSGSYQCLLNGHPIMEHIVTVDDENCARPTSVEQFRSAQREWCKHKATYQSNLSRWQSLYEGKTKHDCLRAEGASERKMADVGKNDDIHTY